MWKSLLPLTYTKPSSELRTGILTISEKWAHYLDGTVSHITKDYLSEKYPINIADENWVINGRLLPNEKILHLVRQLKNNEALLYKDQLIAARMNKEQFNRLVKEEVINELVGVDLSNEQEVVQMVDHPYDLFSMNASELEKDFDLLTKGRESAPISETNKLTNSSRIFLEEGVTAEHAFLDASNGSIYLGANSKVMQGSMVTGGLALCNHAVLKMGAKIYGATTIGPYSKVGGEVNNSVITGYSNKGHDGFLGNSVIGEWCNLGADTNNSNLKNNYDEVRLWNYQEESFVPTGLQFCGLIMGDHSKSGINTMFNTGTVIGVSTNVFGTGFPRNFVPSFSWGGSHGFSTYKFEKACDTASRVLKRRNKEFDQIESNILEHIFHSSSYHRAWEK